MEVVVDDAALARELHFQFNANTPRITARTVSKPTPMSVQPESKKALVPRPIRAKKPNQKTSDADKSSKPIPAKRGRQAENASRVKKCTPKSAVNRKNKTTGTPKPRFKAAQSQDVAMQDVDEVIGAPSPALSTESDVSSFAISSSASSVPSSDSVNGHLIDEAEKIDLLEGSDAQKRIAQVPILNTPITDTVQPLITTMVAIQTPASVHIIQSLGAQPAAQTSLQPNISARRNQLQSIDPHREIGFSHNGPLCTFNPPSQNQFMIPIVHLDPRSTVTDNASWIGREVVIMNPQSAPPNLANHGILAVMGPQSAEEIQASGGHQLAHAEPRVMGQPPVWADKRQQLCETLPYYMAYQSGVYQNMGIPHGMLIDAESRLNDVFDPEIIITRCGGGRGGLDANGHRAQAVHQQSSPIGLAMERAKLHKLAIVAIAGANYRNSVHKGDFLPRRYNVLSHFHVTDVWLEVNDNFQTYCCRLEKIHLEEPSWWATQPYVQSNYDAPRSEIYKCRRCHSDSKCMYAQGWVCLNINCVSYFKLIDGQTGYEGILTSLVYSQRFCSERTPYTGTRALTPLAPPLITQEDMVINARSGTEKVFTKGIVCPRCRCCSRRTNFRKWTCENGDGCDFAYELPVRTLTAQKAQPRLVDGTKWPFYEGLKRVSSVVGHFDVDKFEITGLNGVESGYVFHFKSNAIVNALKDGPDDLFREMQEKDFGLMRRPVRQKGCSGEILTSHYASNWGAPYKFVVSQLSKPFVEAPEVIVKALKKMTWAGEAGQSLTKGGGLGFQHFNELLSIGYYEDTKIGYHDDGEKELGPTIATLSLGSQAEMSLRPKRSAPAGIGHARNNARGTRGVALRILLNHGDIVIMHGEEVQKYFEHAVTPRGTLRYALTCRTILPEKLENDAERAEAARLAKLPEGHEAWNYDGYKLYQETEEDKQKAKSKQIVTALQRTLDDLHTMVQHSSLVELNQVGGVDDVIGAYRRVMSTGPNTDAAVAPLPIREDAAQVDDGNNELSGAEDNSYVMVSAEQPDGVDAVIEDELVDAVGDLDMASSQYSASS